MASLTHCFYVIGIVAFDGLTGATVLPQVRGRQHYNSQVPAFAIVTKAEPHLPVQGIAAVIGRRSPVTGRLRMIRAAFANTFTPPAGAIAADR